MDVRVAIKKAESQRTDGFELWYWRRLLRVSWTTRRSNQSILKKISPEDSSEGLMLKLQYLGHLMRRTDSLEKTLMLGKIEDWRRSGQQRMRWLDGITKSEQAPGVGDGQGGLVCCSPWGGKESDMTEQLNWLTEIKTYKWMPYKCYLWVFFWLKTLSGLYKFNKMTFFVNIKCKIVWENH